MPQRYVVTHLSPGSGRPATAPGLTSTDVIRLLRVLLTAVLALTVLAGCGRQSVPAPSAAVGTRLDQALPSGIAHLHLVDSTGRTRTLADLRGKVIVLQDSMTLCQETCPMDTAALLRTARAVDAAGLGHEVVFVTATVDPQRDTPHQLAAYRRLYVDAHGDPSNWMLLTGSARAVDALWSDLGVYRKRVGSDDDPPPRNWRTGAPLTYDIEHSDEAFFFDQHLHERFILEGMPTATRSGIPQRIYRFLSKEGRDNLHSAGDWTTAQAVQVVSWLTDREITS